MSAHVFYQRLAAAALLGTERQAPPSAAGTPFAELLPDHPNREEALLNAAALAQGYLGAGWQAPQSPHPPLSPAPPDRWPALSDAQHQVFQSVLSDRPQLLGELLGLMVQAQVRPARGWLHRVIREGHFKPELRPLALQVLDERGRWAARFLEYGAWVTPSQLPDSIWDDGSLAERAAYVRGLRGRDPQAARAKLEETWNGETPEAKARLLESLEVGLSLEDEDFLERCLDDKRKEVRSTAVDLLGSLSGSRMVGRMTARAGAFLRIESPKPQGIVGGLVSSLSGKKPTVKIEIALPEKFEKEWTRDGIEQKNVPYGMGEKTWWFQQMVGRVPPSVWGEAQELVPVALREKDWKEVLPGAWLSAAVRFKDAAWTTALMELLPDHQTSAAAQALPTPEVQAQALRRLKTGSGPLEPHSLEWQLLTACPQPWSTEMGAAFIQRLMIGLTYWQKMKQRDWQIASFLPTLALHSPVLALDSIPEPLHQAFRDPEHPLFEAFGKFVETLEFRRRMHQAFSKPGGAL
ncbi:MAG: DUF5691 domain-containing protein [Meiothermus sp.]|nr:DUF5691 domain-containing protein [Meiothermus sp.]